MHILLTDRLSCPRCGPDFGLILLADRVHDRDVEEGQLGCLNCREQYPIRGGEADFRLPGGPQAPEPGPESEGREPQAREPDWVLRTAALLGIRSGPAAVLLLGAQPAAGAELAALVPGLQVVSAGPAPLPPGAAGAGADRILVGPRLPLRSRSHQGVVLAGRWALELLEEAVRVLAPGGRIVVDPAPPGTPVLLEKRGLAPLLEQDGVVVASAGGAR